jgi:antitoxin VapB
MGLKLEGEETRRLAEALTLLTGETVTTAVTVALRERLERVRRERNVGLAHRLLTIGKDCAPRLKEPFRSSEHGQLLYDEYL